jgi:hypothetical protein
MPLKSWLALGASVLAGCAYGYCTGMQCTSYRTWPFMAWEEAPRRAPPLTADRTVSEQDCTKPIANPTANLKCR